MLIGVLTGLTGIACVAFSATLCDRVGRRRMMLIGTAACLPWSLAMIPLIDTGQPALCAVAIAGIQAAGATACGPIAAFIPELFATRYRYTGTALATNLANLAGGGVPPLLAGTLHSAYGSTAVGLMMTAIAAISLVCIYLLPETSGTTLRSTPDTALPLMAQPTARQL